MKNLTLRQKNLLGMYSVLGFVILFSTVTLFLAELYLILFFVSIFNGFLAHFFIKNADNLNGDVEQDWTPSNSIGSSLFPPDELSRSLDRYIPGNIGHSNDYYYNDFTSRNWRDYE